MPIATQNDIRETKFLSHSDAANELGAAAPEVRKSALNVSEVGDRAARLAELLAEDPIDLTRVSDEIRLHVSLAYAVRRIAASLQLLPHDSVSSVEEAAIVLGTERLRVLLHAWPAFEKSQERADGDARVSSENVAASYAASAAAWTPESVYLASFVRLLGLGSGNTADSIGAVCLAASAGTEAAELTEMLVRDFLALIPTVHSRLPGAPRQRDELSAKR
ncbi:MAG: hypothetical protein ACRD5K_01140 [Candidatus Acidiferrales bacterium]